MDTLFAQDASTLIDTLDKHGWAAVFILTMVAGIWSFARWMAPRFDGLFDSHKQFVAELSLTQKQMADTQEQVATCVEEINATQSKLLSMIEHDKEAWRCKQRTNIQA
jgi:hypothetical protein